MKCTNGALPTAIPLAIFVKPTLQPDQNTLYPAKQYSGQFQFVERVWNFSLGAATLFSKMIANITPYMAVASQKITLTKFFEWILGALTAAPIRELPVNQMPHAAPTTEKPKPTAIPMFAQLKGDKWESNSDHPLLQQ